MGRWWSGAVGRRARLSRSHIAPLLFPAFVILFSGCATSHTLSAMEAHDAMRMASRVLGGSHDVQLVMVPSRSAQADAEFLEASRYYGTSGIAEQVAGVFALATNAPQEYAVVGRNSEKTAQVIRDALNLGAGVDRSRLTVVYLGDPEFVPELEGLAVKHGVRLLHVPYPPPAE